MLTALCSTGCDLITDNPSQNGKEESFQKVLQSSRPGSCVTAVSHRKGGVCTDLVLMKSLADPDKVQLLEY